MCFVEQSSETIDFWTFHRSEVILLQFTLHRNVLFMIYVPAEVVIFRSADSPRKDLMQVLIYSGYDI